jgi:hypothetical protein
MKIRALAAAASIVTLISIVPATADILLDTIGTTAFSTGAGGIFIQDQNSTGTEGKAIEFSSGSAATVTEIDAYIGLSLANGPPKNTNVLFGIMANSPAGLPAGVFLDSSSVPLTALSPASLTSLNWSIAAGTYWFVIESEPGSNAIWYGGADTVPAATALNENWGLLFGDKALGARISAEPTVAAVPEPSTWAMILLGFAGVGFMAYRRKQNGLAFRVA